MRSNRDDPNAERGHASIAITVSHCEQPTVKSLLEPLSLDPARLTRNHCAAVHSKIPEPIPIVDRVQDCFNVTTHLNHLSAGQAKILGPPLSCAGLRIISQGSHN